MTIADTPAWAALASHAEQIKGTHLRDLLSDAARNQALSVEAEGILLDFSRQQVTQETMRLLFDLARAAGLEEKVQQMFRGDKINTTENRAVLHVALRAPADAVLCVEGKNVVPDVHEVLTRIEDFSNRVRQGQWTGATGKPLTDVVVIGIGGSYLGPEFALEALRTDPTAHEAAKGRRCRFLANVDPVDVSRALEGLAAETTLVVVNSKTFTTAETMLNAKTVREWLKNQLGAGAVSQHMVAVSTNLEETGKFGIDPNNVFGFWDWVGGRYSVCSAVGVLPLALHYGFPVVQRFLQGAHSMDVHLRDSPLEGNLPVLLGLLGVWNASFMGYPARALLPYSQALLKLAPHIQQVDMESNGKRVSLSGEVLPFATGEVNFGEPGTNGQHSFYQLIHQGRVVPCDFIGFARSQHPVTVAGEPVTNHDELMSNFFAQPDALALGKTEQELRAEGVPEPLIPHKTFPGNRPSSSLLLSHLDAFTAGQLLSLFEHRTAVQGFIWGVNSFDQWGVELGKVLAKNVRNFLSSSKGAQPAASLSSFNSSTSTLLQRYLTQSRQ
eukprot:GILI01005153.1.p1 GENE.GILI01005153.1~~GILI01005153.1.p1  ORF type:complete len:576 (+),score=189.27 GILI01005153.1:66-1730(+)